VTRETASPQSFIRLAAVIRAELAQLAQVVAEAELALRDYPQAEPPRRELRGIGAIVHDFYTGAEHIFEKIASELDGGVPTGAAWHRELLESMGLDLPGLRPPLLTASTVRELHEFLRFRHLFRNVYGFELEWQRLQPLLSRLPAIASKLDAEVQAFLPFLDASSG
jgi:hypothetical protein